MQRSYWFQVSVAINQSKLHRQNAMGIIHIAFIYFLGMYTVYHIALIGQ